MKPQDAQKLARRFIELPQDKRRIFLAAMDREGVDFSLLPIAACEGVAERDGLSYAQQRMWFLWQLDPHSAAYNLPMAVRLDGPLDLAAAPSRPSVPWWPGMNACARPLARTVSGRSSASPRRQPPRCG